MFDLIIIGIVVIMISCEIVEFIGSSYDNVFKMVCVLVLKGVVFGNEIFYKYLQNGQIYVEFCLIYCDMMVVVFGYSVELCVCIIDCWQELEVGVVLVVVLDLCWFDQLLVVVLQFVQIVQEQQVQLIVQQLKVCFVEVVGVVLDLQKISEVVKVLGIGLCKLLQFMCMNSILMCDNLFYQQYIDWGCFCVVEVLYIDCVGVDCICIEMCVIGCGVIYLQQVLVKNVLVGLLIF